MFLHKLKARVASLICLSLYTILHQPLLAAEQGQTQATPPTLPNVYEKIVRAHLPSLTKALLDEERTQKEISTTNRIQNNDAELFNFNSPIKEASLGPVETYRLLCGILQKHYAHEVCPFIADNTLADLELFCGSPRILDCHVFGKLDNTITTIGKIELQKMLITPITDIRELQRRQKLIKQLSDNPELIKSLEESLQKIKQYEANFAWFWKQTDEFFEASLQRMYWEKTPLINLAALNKSTTAQGLNALQVTGYNPIFTFLFLIPLGAIVIAIIVSILDENAQNAQEKIIQYLGVTSLALIAVFIFYFVNEITLVHAKSYNNTSNAIQKKMIGVAQYVQALQDIKKAISERKDLDLLPSDKTIFESFNGKNNSEQAALCRTLSSATFKGVPSLFSDKGSVLVAFKIMHEIKDCFIDVMRTVGTLDAYLSLAKLYNKSIDAQQNHYCLVDYDTQETPQIAINGLWHPLNASHENTNETNNAPLQPQATTLAIIMAHTCGIAPAQKMHITPHATFLSNLLTGVVQQPAPQPSVAS